MLRTLSRFPSAIGKAIAAEMAADVSLPLTKRIQLWRSGFKSSSYQLFDLQNNDWNNYVTDIEVTRAGHLNGPFRRILKDKLLFSLLLSETVNVPEVLGIVEAGHLYTFPSPEHLAVPALAEMAFHEGIVLKPIMGNKGKGVFVFPPADLAAKDDSRSLPITKLEGLISELDGYMVTRMVHQAAYAHRIFRHAANTIRIITMRDPATGEVFIPMAMQRFGSSLTIPTDNFQTGGISAAIDLESGQLGYAVRHPRFADGNILWLNEHPETGEAIRGVKVPLWPQVKATVLSLMNTFSMFNYVGWDILVTDRDVVVIEGNHNINLGIQVHGPLLTNFRVKRFFQHHGVLSRGRPRPLQPAKIEARTN